MMKWISFCLRDAYFKKKKSEKNQFSFILFQLCQTSCLNVSRKQSLSVNWNLPRTKVTVDLANYNISDNNKSRNKLFSYRD